MKSNDQPRSGSINKCLVGIVFVLFSSVASHAQNISTQTILWSSTKAVDQVDNSEVIYNCSFKTYGVSTVDWIQGNRTSNYTVTSVEGQWTDLSQDGQLTYNIQSGIVTGTITFSRLAGQLSIHMSLLVNGKPDLNYIFSIASINVQ